MAESTITAKGQTTVPQQVRDALGAQPGARLAWHVLSDGTVIVRAKTKELSANYFYNFPRSLRGCRLTRCGSCGAIA